MVDKLSKLLLLISIVVFSVSSQSGAAAFEHTLSPGWNFVSLPFSPSGAAPSSFLKLFDSAGALKIDGVRTLGVEGGIYADSQTVTAHFNGRGYLIYSPGAYKLRLDGVETPTSSPVSVSLKKGWNLVGAPYNADVSWDSDITVDGAALTLAADKIDPRLYTYDAASGAFSPVRVFEGKLEPWKAYFVKAKQDCVLTFAAKGEAGRGSIVGVNIDGLGAQLAVSGEVVVSLAEGADAAAALAEIEALGGVVTKSNPQAGLYLVSIPTTSGASEFSASLSSAPGVEGAVPNIVLSSTDLVPDDPPYTAPGDSSQRWAFEKINAPRAWATASYTSQPLIAIVDTGVDASSPDLAGRVSEGKSFTGLSAGSDPSGHGTHIAGVIAAAGNNAQGVAGVCWKCGVLPVQVCDAAGNCPLFSVLDGVAYSSEQGAKIINISLSGYAPPGSVARKIFQSSVNRAAAGGALIVGAAGNGSQDAGDTIPAGLDNVLAVTASGQSDGRPSFANYGPSVDIAAPGENIYSLLPSLGAGFTNGTSAAAAFVSGAAGLLMSQNPGMTANAAAAALLSTAAPVSFSPSISGGRLDIGAAMDPPAPVNQPPVISGCSFTPGSVPSDGGAGASLICNITDPENAIASVGADLAPIGGGSPANLTGAGGSLWTIDNVPAGAGTPPGAYEITITAVDAEGGYAAATAALIVSPPPNGAPVVSGCDFLPHGLAPDGVTPAAVTVTVTDADGPGDISALTIDLSQVGGSSSALLYDDGLHGDGAAGDGVFGLSGITIPSNNPQGVFELPVSAVDSASGNGAGSCVVAVNASLAPQAACSSSWPRFHCNSEGSGEASGYTIATPLTKSWTYTTGEAIYSSPAIDAASGRLFIGSGIANIDKGLLILNANTGALIQSCAMAGSGISTPAFSNNKVFAAGYTGDNNIYAFNALDCSGGPLATIPTGASVQSSPLVYGGNVFVGSLDGKLYAFDENTYAALPWSPYVTAGQSKASPSGDAGNVYFTGGNKVYAVKISDGSTVWTFTVGGGAITASPAISGGVVFIGDEGGNFYALNGNTGAQVWPSFSVGANIYSSPVVANGNVYVISNSGVVYARKQSDGTAVWTRNLGGGTVISTPVVVDGKIIFGQGSTTNIIVLKESDGAVLQNKLMPGGVTSSPAVYNNKIYFGSLDKKVYCMSVNAPPAVGAINFTVNPLLADNYATTTVTAVVSDANGLSDIASVTVNLAQLGGSASTTLYDDGTNGDVTAGDGVYSRSNITAATSTTAGAKTLTVTAVDLSSSSATGTGALTINPNTAPVITSCSFAPVSIMANGAASAVLTCTGVSDADSNLQTVTVNLAALGGSASAALTSAGAGTWQRAAVTAALGTPAATYTITVTATDIAGATGTQTAPLGVTAPNTAPAVSSVTFTPASVVADGATTFVVTATVSDPNGLSDIATVTANLSSIGGSAAAPMYDDGAHGDGPAGNGVYGANPATVASGTAAGAYFISVTATDTAGLSGSSSSNLTVTSPNTAPAVSACVFNPTSVSANGSTYTGLRCLVSDLEANVTTVTADLSALGGSAVEPLSSIGAGLFETASFTVPLGTTPATYTVNVIATDSAGATGTASGALGVTSLNPWFVQACADQPAGRWLPLNNPGMVNMPRDATVSDNDDIYMADTGNHRVAQFDKNCVFIRNWGYLGNANGNFKSPTGIVFNPAVNYIYVADFYDRVQRFTKSGVYVDTIYVTKPSSVAVDSSGNLFVTSKTGNLLSKFDTSGTLTATWTVSAPLGVDLDASGNVYMSLPASNTIMKLNPSTGATSTIGTSGSGSAQFNDPRGIAIDAASGTIFISDYGNNRVQELTLSGAYVQEFNQYGSGPGQINYSEGVSLTNSKNLLILDTLNSRLQEFKTF